jgi:pteridine reductase
MGDSRVVLITGGAKRIGAEIARTLHGRGWDIAISYRRAAAEAHALIDALNASRPDSAAMFAADLDDRSARDSLIPAVLAHFNRLDGLIHNASTFYPTPFGSATDAQWDELIDSNARAPYFLSQAAAPALRAARGAIVSIIDIYAERALPNYPVYCMAKAALAMLTQSLAKELGPEVRVNGVAPGNILWSTNMVKAETPAIVVERTALKRQGEPADIAQMVAFLLSDAPYVTGQIIAVDGGRRGFI